VIEDLLAELERRHGLAAGDGLQVLGPAALLVRPFDPGWPLLLVPDAASIAVSEPAAETTAGAARAGLAAGSFRPAVLPGRAAHRLEPLEFLRAFYPPAHPVLSFAGEPDTTVGELVPEDLQRPRLVPALEREANVASPYGLAWIVARLRAPDGCPWDREQDHLSLRKHLLEEAYEVYDALERGSTPALAEELGDLLLQIVLHAQYGAEAGVFDLADVQAAIAAKIVRRHPHVFGATEASSVAQVVRNWEAIKAAERVARTQTRGGTAAAAGGEGTVPERAMPEAFAGLSRSLPALAYAQEMQERAAALGYDWPDVEGVIEKIGEEAAELLAAEGPQERHEEYGDLLLVLVNLGRKLNLDAEAALRAASAKFAARFAAVERLAGERDVQLAGLSLEELDELWQAAKEEGRA
jgi:MazG family protein